MSLATIKEKEWISWSYVIVWSLVIFATLPFTRSIQKFILHLTSDTIYLVFSLVTVAILLAVLIRHLTHTGSGSIGRYIWMGILTALLLGTTATLNLKVEALHFIEYGFLGYLAYRALSHRIDNISVYVIATLFGLIIGIIDEGIQWALPNRVWDIRDIIMNLSGAVLAQLIVATVLRPSCTSRRPDRASIALTCRYAMIATVLLGASLMNTPQRIKWYSNLLPELNFLIKNTSIMVEYGYLYLDPEVGKFRSRLQPDELYHMDMNRGPQVARLLTTLSDKYSYRTAINFISPFVYPFAHEAIVRIARREHHTSKAHELFSRDGMENSKKIREHLTIAFWENKILEAHFSNTLHHMNIKWIKADQIDVSRIDSPAALFESNVSRSLITRFNEKTMLLLFAGIFIFLLGTDIYVSRRLTSLLKK